MFSVLFFLAVIPVIVICTYIYAKDRNKEPGPLLIKLFLLGIASCFLVLLLSEIVFKILPFMNKETTEMTFFEIMAYAFIGVALIEEFSKWVMTYFGAYSNKAYDEVYDGIVYAVYVSLGFAFFENLLYVFGNQSIIIGISRGLLAVPGHACDAVFMGYYLSIAKVYASQGKKDLEKKNLILSVIVPTILHGIYDFCLFANVGILIIVFFIFVITIYILSFKKIKLLAAQCRQQSTPAPVQYAYNQSLQPAQYSNNNQSTNYFQQNESGYVNLNNISKPQAIANKFCPNCGTEVRGAFCEKCGTRQN